MSLLTDLEAALVLGLSVHTLRRERSARSRGLGIPCVRIGGAVRYRPADLEAWLNKLAIAPNPPPEPFSASQPKQPEPGKRGRGRPRLLPDFKE